MESGAMAVSSRYPEAEDYILNYSKNNALDQYLNLIEKVKSSVEIPIIGSINCVSDLECTSFALNMQEAGVDALELNVYFIPNNIKRIAR
jgi:dihydroorotate dehydrogenase (fumarate)